MSEVKAAPPDAGGHLGSMTRPDDVLMRPSEAQRREASPPLHRMHRPRVKRVRSAFPPVVIGVIALGLLGMFVLGLMPMR